MRTKRLTHWFRFLALGIILAMVMASCAVPTAKPGIGTSDGNRATSPACGSAGPLVEAPNPALDSLKPLVRGFAQREEIPGGVLLLVHRGKIVFWEAFGYADPDDKKPFKKDTVVFLASTTKPIAATAIMTLVDEGILALDDPVSRYLPEFKTLLLEDGSTTTAPTIRQLLSHTSGWSGNQEMSSDGTDACRDVSLTMKESAALIAGDKLLARPGQRFSYGPLSFQVAGRAAEVSSGKSFDQLIQQKVFLPLGMTDTTFRPTPEQGERVAGIFRQTPWGGLLNLFRYDFDQEIRLPRVAAGLYSTARDVAVFLQMNLNKGTYGGCRVLSADSVAEMQKHQIGDAEIGNTPGNVNSYGLGWIRKDRSDSETTTRVSHGGLFGTVGWIDPERELVGVLFTPMPLKQARTIHEKIRARVRELIPVTN